MNHSQLFTILYNQYSRLDPYHKTWKLWLKVDKSERERFEVIIGKKEEKKRELIPCNRKGR